VIRAVVTGVDDNHMLLGSRLSKESIEGESRL
jgi:hypothetical protein